MKILKLVNALILMSFCLFANAELMPINSEFGKNSQDVHISNDTKTPFVANVSIEYQNIGFTDFDSNSNIIEKYHGSTIFKPDKENFYIDARFYRMSGQNLILTGKLSNDVGRYKPHISYQF